MTGFNLPPGVNTNMIPGNRPEDEAEEAFWTFLDEKFEREFPQHSKIVTAMMTGGNLELDPSEPMENAIYQYVIMARDIGYDRGLDDGKDEALMQQAIEEQERHDESKEIDPIKADKETLRMMEGESEDGSN